jgi:hypothetical protein
MNPERVHQRGLAVLRVEPATLAGVRLSFDKRSATHPGAGHACLDYARSERVEGVLYWLAGDEDILRMDPFERTPVNYSRDVVVVETVDGPVTSWTYHVNPGARQAGLRPPRSYLAHLLAGQRYMSSAYYQRLAAWPCLEDG